MSNETTDFAGAFAKVSFGVLMIAATTTMGFSSYKENTSWSTVNYQNGFQSIGALEAVTTLTEARLLGPAGTVLSDDVEYIKEVLRALNEKNEVLKENIKLEVSASLMFIGSESDFNLKFYDYVMTAPGTATKADTGAFLLALENAEAKARAELPNYKNHLTFSAPPAGTGSFIKNLISALR